MTPSSWTTDAVHPRDRIDAWRDRLACQTYRKTIAPEDTAGFYGAIAHVRLGELCLARARSVPQVMTAGAARGAPAYVVALNLYGGAELEQNGAAHRLAPGDLVVLRADQPHRVAFRQEWEQLALIVPAERFEVAFPALAAVTPLRIAGSDPLAAIAARFLGDLAGNAAGLPEDFAVDLGGHALGLVSAAARRSVDPSGLAPSMDQALRLQRTKQFIDRHLQRPGLDPSLIAVGAGLSERSLHRLFHPTGISVAGYVRDRRLERCAAALRDPYQRGRSVAEIAYAWGFTSASVFSRVFRGRYGCSPRAYREGAGVP
jgi:AraC-like DNA-binding protein